MKYYYIIDNIINVQAPIVLKLPRSFYMGASRARVRTGGSGVSDVTGHWPIRVVMKT